MRTTSISVTLPMGFIPWQPPSTTVKRKGRSWWCSISTAISHATDAGNFAPWLEGNTDDDAYPALELSGRVNFSGANTGSVPVMVFDARYSTEATALVRPLFRWRSNTQTSLMQMDANGNLGIGVATPSQLLDVNGQTRVRNIPVGTGNPVYFDGSGNLNDGTGSSIHFKENIQDLQFDKDAFLSMRPVSFKLCY